LYYGDETCKTVNCEVAAKFSISLGKCLKMEEETGNCQFHMKVVIHMDLERDWNSSHMHNNYSVIESRSRRCVRMTQRVSFLYNKVFTLQGVTALCGIVDEMPAYFDMSLMM
jgi:hypothetical protein